MSWLVLAYTLPPEPSRNRVSVWRRLRKLGAVYLNEGVWVLPDRQDLADEVSAVIKSIQELKGTASAFAATDLDAGQERRVRDRFLEARREEYAALQGQFARFHIHVEHATSTVRFTFAEIEELEEEVTKLERWLGEIHSRDFFESEEHRDALKSLQDARHALQQFTELAFSAMKDKPQNPEPGVPA
jgi:chromosome segregation ATPase